jgi:hypothetical protein
LVPQALQEQLVLPEQCLLLLVQEVLLERQVLLDPRVQRHKFLDHKVREDLQALLEQQVILVHGAQQVP